MMVRTGLTHSSKTYPPATTKWSGPRIMSGILVAIPVVPAEPFSCSWWRPSN